MPSSTTAFSMNHWLSLTHGRVPRPCREILRGMDISLGLSRFVYPQKRSGTPLKSSPGCNRGTSVGRLPFSWQDCKWFRYSEGILSNLCGIDKPQNSIQRSSGPKCFDHCHASANRNKVIMILLRPGVRPCRLTCHSKPETRNPKP